MLCITDNSTDPYFNLAAEEYLLKEFSQPLLRLWRNSDSVIVGRYQNTLAEINLPYLREHGIKVVRRLTGGGAVYHDLGNLNYSFIARQERREESSALFSRFTAPVVEALQNLGINARLEGRNDLVIDGKKFSGNAICLHNNRILHHGTLLFSSSAGRISSALKEKGEKFKGKAVESHRTRVTNISEHLGRKMEIEEFIRYLTGYLCRGDHFGERLNPYSYSAADIRAIERLCREKYSTDEWNYGHSPAYQFRNRRRYEWGTVELCFNVKGGVISTLKIYGDYFFTKPTEEFCALMEGCSHTMEAVREKLSSVELDGYFNNISPDELTELFF